MSSKALIKLIIMLGILIGVCMAIPRIVYRKHANIPYQNIKADEWQKIIVHTTTDSCTFLKKNKVWEVISASYTYRADQNGVQNIIDAISKLEKGDTVTQNPERHNRFEVNETSATAVALFTADLEKPAASLYIGKITPDYTNWYARFEGSQDVAAISNFSRYLVNKTFDQWRNRMIGVEKKETVDTVVCTDTAGAVHTVKRAGAVWTYNDKEVSAADADPLLGTLTSLRATELILPKDEGTIKKSFTALPAVVLTITAGDTQTTINFFLKKEKKGEKPQQYYAIKKDEPGIFVINIALVNSMQDELNKLKESSLKPPEPPQQEPPETPATKP